MAYGLGFTVLAVFFVWVLVQMAGAYPTDEGGSRAATMALGFGAMALALVAGLMLSGRLRDMLREGADDEDDGDDSGATQNGSGDEGGQSA